MGASWLARRGTKRYGRPTLVTRVRRKLNEAQQQPKDTKTKKHNAEMKRDESTPQREHD